jgi:hypothetical protein
MNFPLSNINLATLPLPLLLKLRDMLLQLVEVVHTVVAHAKTAHVASGLGFDERSPGAIAVSRATVRGVDEDQVNVVEASFGEGFGDLRLGVLVAKASRRDFGCEEDGGAWNGRACFFNGRAAGTFVFVACC